MSTDTSGGRAPSACRGYLRGRVSELALPATRAASEPLAQWAQHRVRLDGRPFSFEGHEYLRAIFDDTAPHIVLSKAAQIGGTTWSAIQVTTAAGVLGVVDLMRTGALPAQGFVKQEHVKLADFLNTEFGQLYRAGDVTELNKAA